MTFLDILRLPSKVLASKAWVFAIGLSLVTISALWPTDLDRYPLAESPPLTAHLVEDYGRHANTLAAIAVPLILRDWTGLKQLVTVTFFGILATHGPKRLLNDVEIAGLRLGQRPNSPDSRHNMPSGHSALASAAIWFLGRRYSWWWLLLTIPVTGLTMWTRVMLNAHTISAVIAGCLVGLMVTALFVTRKTR